MTVQQKLNSFRTGPDEHGHFGIYGGRFVAETLMPLILDLEQAYTEARADPAFRAEMDILVLVSNCPQMNNPCNDFNPTPLRMIITAAQ